MGELSSAEQVEVLSSIPGIHHNVISMVENLAAFVSESRDNEARLRRRLDDLSNLVIELRQRGNIIEGVRHYGKGQQRQENDQEEFKSSCTG